MKSRWMNLLLATGVAAMVACTPAPPPPVEVQKAPSAEQQDEERRKNLEALAAMTGVVRVELAVDQNYNVTDPGQTCTSFSNGTCFLSKGLIIDPISGRRPVFIGWNSSSVDHFERFTTGLCSKSKIGRKKNELGDPANENKTCRVVKFCKAGGGQCRHPYDVNGTDPEIIIDEGTDPPGPDTTKKK